MSDDRHDEAILTFPEDRESVETRDIISLLRSVRMRVTVLKPTRERSLTVTKIEEALLWLSADMELRKQFGPVISPER